jgi:hypothetical protein
MKKLLILTLSLLVLFVSNYAFAEGSGTVKIGLDMSGEHEVSGLGLSGSEDVEMGFSLSVEYVAAINENLGLGAGITYQMPRSQEDFEGDFNFMPIYGLVKLRATSNDISPYLIGQLGYNLFYGDSDYKGSGSLSGGIYYGIGAGIIFQKGFQVELLYSVNNGSYELLGYDFDIEYSKIGLFLGYNF